MRQQRTLAGRQGTSRALNKRMILSLLRSEGAKSRAEISVLTGLSPAAVTFIVTDLMKDGFLVEGAATKGATGRRPIPIEINYAGSFVAGFKVIGQSIDCVLTGLSAQPVADVSILVEDMTPEGVVRAAKTGLDALRDKTSSMPGRLVGAGLSIPGMIDTETGYCHQSYRLGWKDIPIGNLLADCLRLPVWVDDDTNAFALSQLLFGIGREHKSFGALAIGAGISCAVVIDGKVHTGSHGAAGKIGHTPCQADGPICECGKRGCLQANYSEPVIVERWRKEVGAPETVTRDDMMQAAVAGDPVARAILHDAGTVIGQHLAAFSNIMDPSAIVVGGEAVLFSGFLLDPMKEALKLGTNWISPIVIPDWDDQSWVKGAAALATQKIFDFEAVTGSIWNDVSSDVQRV